MTYPSPIEASTAYAVPGMLEAEVRMAHDSLVRIQDFTCNSIRLIEGTADRALRDHRITDALDCKQWLDGALDEGPRGPLMAGAFALRAATHNPDATIQPHPNRRSHRAAKRIGNAIHESIFVVR